MGLNEFIDYCEDNARGESALKNFDYGNRDVLRHYRKLKELFRSPSYILNKSKTPSKKYMEVGLIDDDGTDISAIDLVVIDNEREIYIAELKNGQNHALEYKANCQLKKQYKFIKGKFRVLPISASVLVSRGGRFKVKLIQPYVFDLLDLNSTQ